ncbi:hypothetical protein CEUSTIGMA_g12541.t1 [Chlamydomonas eustigma]|uniref:F-box domain-containing protein n=1 Tax=Chlamydomonas eustigma TaxID=1157962 RepID=A0A250XPW5_9CHLO|nr:hypothetical protein CEUSTIGMA_g12541.t1 [Chlamydomonas eustigma]|eukprot:GAX85121.1 hypothetical protein CEUSTIGMA_g12541.t1 [Chlamydomonas eustigma]
MFHRYGIPSAMGFLELPNVILDLIFSLLSLPELASLSISCRAFNKYAYHFKILELFVPEGETMNTRFCAMCSSGDIRTGADYRIAFAMHNAFTRAVVDHDYQIVTSFIQSTSWRESELLICWIDFALSAYEGGPDEIWGPANGSNNSNVDIGSTMPSLHQELQAPSY